MDETVKIPSDSAIVDMPPPTEDVKPSLPGGGSKLSELNDVLFEAPSDLVGRCSQYSFNAFIALMVGFHTGLVDSEWLRVISVLMGMGYLTCLAAIFLHKLCLRKRSAATGLMGIAFVTSAVPLISTITVRDYYCAGLILTCYAGLGLVIGIEYLWPSASPKSSSASATQAAPEAEDHELTSLSARSGEKSEAPSDEDETLPATTTTTTTKKKTVSQSVAPVPQSRTEILQLCEITHTAEKGEILAATPPPTTSVISQSIAPPVSLSSTKIVKLQAAEDHEVTSLRGRSGESKAPPSSINYQDATTTTPKTITVGQPVQLGEITASIAGEEGEIVVAPTKIVELHAEDVRAEWTIREAGVVCFVIRSDPKRREMKGFLKRVLGKYRIASINVLPNGAFLVKFYDYSTAVNVAPI